MILDLSVAKPFSDSSKKNWKNGKLSDKNCPTKLGYLWASELSDSFCRTDVVGQFSIFPIFLELSEKEFATYKCIISDYFVYKKV